MGGRVGGAEGGSRGDGAARILGLHLSDRAQDGGGSDPSLPSFTAAGSLQGNTRTPGTTWAHLSVLQWFTVGGALTVFLLSL